MRHGFYECNIYIVSFSLSFFFKKKKEKQRKAKTENKRNSHSCNINKGKEHTTTLRPVFYCIFHSHDRAASYRRRGLSRQGERWYHIMSRLYPIQASGFVILIKIWRPVIVKARLVRLLRPVLFFYSLS